MFWTIVGALAFFFIGIPLIIELLGMKEFWGCLFLIILLLVAVVIGFLVFNKKKTPNKAMEPIPVAVTMTANALIAPPPYMAHLGR
jgi:hypothetical protein